MPNIMSNGLPFRSARKTLGLNIQDQSMIDLTDSITIVTIIEAKKFHITINHKKILLFSFSFSSSYFAILSIKLSNIPPKIIFTTEAITTLAKISL